jgi:hypothetical protein
MTDFNRRTTAESTTCIEQAISWLESGVDQATTVRLLRNKYKISRATAYRDVKQAAENMEALPQYTMGGPLEVRDRLLQTIRYTLAKVSIQIDEAEELNPQLIQLQLKLVKQEKDLMAMGGHGKGYNSPKSDPIAERIIKNKRDMDAEGNRDSKVQIQQAAFDHDKLF